MKPFEKYLNTKNNNWNLPEGRVFVRKECRNNPELLFNNECVSYGALTGEKTAQPFMHFGSVLLQKDDIVIFYSDGLKPAIDVPNFFNIINKSTSSLLEQALVPFLLKLAKEKSVFGKERTYVIFRHQ